MAFASGPTIARARNAGAALNAVGSGQPASDAKRISVSMSAMSTATSTCRPRPRTTVRGSVIMKKTKS